jgi:hypothetical protein
MRKETSERLQLIEERMGEIYDGMNALKTELKSFEFLKRNYR